MPCWKIILRTRIPQDRSRPSAALILRWCGASSAWWTAPSTSASKPRRDSKFPLRLSATVAAFPLPPSMTVEDARLTYSSKQRHKHSFSESPRTQMRKDSMRNLLNLICILSLACILAAQTPATTPAPAAKPSTTAGDNLPSETTVDSFLHQQFGYEKDLTWKITSIKRSEEHT